MNQIEKREPKGLNLTTPCLTLSNQRTKIVDEMIVNMSQKLK